MKVKYLGQALKFACMPTLAVLVLLFFGFFSIDKTLAFIGSDNGWAIFLRVILVILEIVLVIIMYFHYEERDLVNQAKSPNLKFGDERNTPDSLKNLVGWSYYNEYKCKIAHIDHNTVVIKKV